MSNVKETVNNILVNNGLDFKIIKQPFFATVNGKQVETPYFGLRNEKTGEFINSVMKGYIVSQNADIIEAIVRGTQKFGQVSVNRAHSLKGGRKVIVQLAIEGNAKVGNDTIKRYITIIDSNDGSCGLSVGIGDFTMSCQNQAYWFQKNAQYKMRHTASMEYKIAQLPFMIENALSFSMQMMDVYKTFQSTKVSRNLAHDLVKELVGIDRRMSEEELEEVSTRKMNMMSALYDNIEKEMNSKGDNLWGLHSGVTRWTTHEKSHPTFENGQLFAIATEQGNNYKTNVKSLNFALDHAGIEMP